MMQAEVYEGKQCKRDTVAVVPPLKLHVLPLPTVGLNEHTSPNLQRTAS